jgi:hypothetical protein
MTFRARYLTTWLALLSVTLYALWPLLATMQPREVGAVYQLCPHTALHQMAEQSALEKPSSNPIWNNQGLQCVFALGIGDGASAAPSAPVALIVDTLNSDAASEPRLSIPEKPNNYYLPAPRGPPRFS